MGDSRLTAPQIRDYVGGRSFDLGMKYLGDGAIFNARCEGTKLTASCRGSHCNSYRVRATLGGKGVLAASCTCPVGSGSSQTRRRAAAGVGVAAGTLPRGAGD